MFTERNLYKEDRKHAKQIWKNNIQINCEALIANNFCVFCFVLINPDVASSQDCFRGVNT